MRRAGLIIPALVALALLGSAHVANTQERPWTPLPSPLSATCPGGICQPEALKPFFAALERPGGVHIVQFGDSHTAGDVITRSLHWRLQGRFSDKPDITVTAIGEVGATLRSLETRAPLLDPLRPAPDLIILAYGTNEGFDELLDPAAYEAQWRHEIWRARQEAPGAALMILGPPEAMRGDGGGTCPDDLEHRWRAPPMLAVVRDVQHRVAADMGVAFWDWRGRMGGDCSAHRLAIQAEPMMRGDHVHFTAAGGDWIGALLFEDLMAADAAEGRGR